jgi:hypothetical protein
MNKKDGLESFHEAQKALAGKFISVINEEDEENNGSAS